MGQSWRALKPPDSIGVELLSAIRQVFLDRKTDRLLTIDLLEALVAREGEGWGDWWGKEVTLARKRKAIPHQSTRRLAEQLRPYGVLPKEVRTPAGKGKGYVLHDFEDAFSRYLDSAGGADPPGNGPDERDAATTHAAQGFEASRSPNGANPNATSETVGAQALSRCRVRDAQLPTGGEEGPV